MPRQNIGERINTWLAEAPGQTFTRGKWRFWWPAITAFTLFNAILTAVIFNDGGRLQAYMGAVLVGAGALLVWLCVGFLHYSDGADRRLARGVSLLDSITLCFVIAHFCGLLWVYGRLHTLQSAEVSHAAAVEKYNAEARQIQADNAKIAEAMAKAAEADRQRARIENDSIYQARKAAEAGVRIAPRQGAAASASLSTSPVELAKPPEALKDSAAEFLTRWDALIRLANFGELILAAVTLIFIRNRTAKTNEPASAPVPIFNFDITSRAPAPVGNLTAKKEPAKNHGSFDSEGLKILREVLRDISFRLHKRSFKSAVRGDAVWIYLMRANNGTQEAEASAKAKLSLLDDAVKMEREAFRERLEAFLRQNGFDL
jgi:hypothetical protein